MVNEVKVYEENPLFDMAEKFIMQTSRSLFLTGKAGTGKTTFLRKIRETTTKRTVVVAPTGVAAINAGGTTIHSFFQLPFTPFLPSAQMPTFNNRLFDQYGLLQNLRIESDKRKLFRELELLIIDEVSMVRCDILDAIDVILRHFRRKEYLPFGGVQVLLIGDLFQLPPVTSDEQWNLLSTFYSSPFFFDSKVMLESPPVFIELKKIYRQRDPHFIRLLNSLRNNQLDYDDLEILNARYQPDFRPAKDIGYVTLTTHNQKADRMNAFELSQLPGDAQSFEGSVEGDFPERLFPTDLVLTLKPGSQIMFIKNDMERIRRYYNGKIGTIRRIESDRIVVGFPGEENEIEVEKETWRNVRYFYNEASHQVEEDVIGTFTQYAIRLAWAITIHKSQGLTFDKVIIDAGSSFAAGQVYVALSRCTSLEGIILYSKIFRSSVRTDDKVLEFAGKELEAEKLTPILHQGKQEKLLHAIIDIFDWNVLQEEVKQFQEYMDEKKSLDKVRAHEVMDEIELKLKEHQEIALRYVRHLESHLAKKEFEFVKTRVDAGIQFFCKVVDDDYTAPLKKYDDELKELKKVKQIRKRIKELIDLFSSQRKLFVGASLIASRFSDIDEDQTIN